MRPDEYAVQLELYREAAPDLLAEEGGRGLPVRTLLFYLRGGTAVESPGAGI